MFGLLSPSREEPWQRRPAVTARESTLSFFSTLKRSAFTFESQHISKIRLRVEPDVEAGAESSPPELVVPPSVGDKAPTKIADVGKGRIPDNIVPDLNVIAPTPPSSPPESEDEDGNQDDSDGDDDKIKVKVKWLFDEPQTVVLEEKESYDFLQNDGRWHRKPHVYEYNQSSARLLHKANPNLFYTLLQKDRKAPKKCVLNVATMQSIVIQTYQREITEAGKELLDGQMSVMLPQLLHNYCNALRDMDYMQEKAANGFDNDPFLLMTSKQMERELMQDHGLLDHVDSRDDLPPSLDEEDPRLPGVGRTARIHAAQLENRFNKLYSALGGGLALIVPMIIMRLETGTVSCLVTTSSCVLIFSLVIAYRSNMRPNDILAVTAAYTAVLVVFVGTTT
ncbi:hypothetical protein LTR36_002762 [Oleoguttula mirabilis]|uniref:DUF6594 domain-containing protein n=1 Tax=Oleoguttula mirabilis TaxID=1507867 RepID=A0AAV9JJS5_9PEZI|nr:hypothetical protein LTR36_002762 [Oleoguttula mirabilis]